MTIDECVVVTRLVSWDHFFGLQIVHSVGVWTTWCFIPLTHRQLGFWIGSCTGWGVLWVTWLSVFMRVVIGEDVRLADLANLMQSWVIETGVTWTSTIRGFKNSGDVSMALEKLERVYCELTGYGYPIEETTFVWSWMVFRVVAWLAIIVRTSHPRTFS
ncbi:hypothetical protein JB92DRAFT_2833013 [Gautieria morchelliformis]|nr:hypothetical protein JB92DRAFT_2833013 [Gautieria morchelliformis]